MKKIYIGLLIGLFLISLATAVTLGVFNDIKVSKEDYTRLQNVNSLEITHTAINCNSEDCDIVYIKTGYGRTTWKPEPYWDNCTLYNEEGNCQNFAKVYYTNEELNNQLEEQKKNLKDNILTRIKINEDNLEEKTTKVEVGTTTIIEKDEIKKV